jgi:urease accessory protein
MYDGGCLSEPSLLQRAVGELRIAVKRSGAETVLDELRQAGCLKARFPRRVVPGWMDAVMLNTGGGVAGGDRLNLSIGVGAGARATIAAQAAERFYRARAGDAPATVRTHLAVEAGAALEWLPQETILFDHSAVDRRLEADLAADARFLGVETIVFGRTAMGERVGQGWLRDLIRIRRAGNLLLHDAIRIDGALDATLQHAAVAGGAKVVATIVYVAADTDEKLAVLRLTALSPPAPSTWRPRSPPPTPAHEPTEAAATIRNGMLMARILGPNGASVRRTLIAALAVLREDRPLPRVWLC